MNLSNLVDEAEEYGIPVLAVTAVGKDMNRDARYLGLCCRIAAELGAHIVKTYHCENFPEVAESCPVPIVIAGGKRWLNGMHCNWRLMQFVTAPLALIWDAIFSNRTIR